MFLSNISLGYYSEACKWKNTWELCYGVSVFCYIRQQSRLAVGGQKVH